MMEAWSKPECGWASWNKQYNNSFTNRKNLSDSKGLANVICKYENMVFYSNKLTHLHIGVYVSQTTLQIIKESTAGQIFCLQFVLVQKLKLVIYALKSLLLIKNIENRKK